MSKLRPELVDGKGDRPCPNGGTAYLLVHDAVRRQGGLIHGQLHSRGAHCAIGSYFEDHPRTSLPSTLIDEVALVNDSRPNVTPQQRRLHVLRWLRWRLAELKMPGFQRFVEASKK